ncbi:hypothetical protein GOP47_0020638 [Adiantum capillus-veneris]|uniref:Protein GAMETE EXPRESSED 3 n=1 Tax=Adiantum capillus-veneris TaxID=13818 RepID=A0A9D4Z697_ADICA|nr:hypothetical protein GOP47_0020638 [Adiantum capillus-veneris]
MKVASARGLQTEFSSLVAPFLQLLLEWLYMYIYWKSLQQFHSIRAKFAVIFHSSLEFTTMMQIRGRTLNEQCPKNGFWVVAILLTVVRFCFGIPQLSKPTIGSDQLIYACANKEVVAFQGNGTIYWRVGMNQTCQTTIAPVIDYDGRVYVAADQTVVVVTPPSSAAEKPSAADFFSMVPTMTLKAIGNFSSITGLAVTSWSSVLYINTGTGLHAFMFDGTPLWSTIVQFNNSAMVSPKSMGSCAYNMTNCTLLPYLAVDECDGSIYVARTDGWLFSYATWQPFLRWSYALSADIPLSAKVITGNNGRVYAAIAKYDMIYAISTELGTLVWQVKVGPLSEASCTPRVDLLGFVSVGSLDGFLYVISPDGAFVRKYLAANNLSLVSILVAPVLDCSRKALFVAQTRVLSKTIMQKVDGTKGLGITQYLGINLYMLAPSSGQVLWSTLYPGLFPAALLTRDLSLYTIDPDWLIAITAIANLSSSSLCESEENLYKASCSEFLFTVSKTKNPGSNGPLIAFSISILIIFLLLSLLSALMYCCWRKKQTIHRQRLCLLLKQERFRHPQGLLLNRRRMYLRNIEYLQAELDVQPKSAKILDQLRIALEGLHFLDRYLAMFPSDTLLGDHFHQERILVEDAMAASAVASTDSRGGFWSGLMKSVFHILFGALEEEDFGEELQILSEYDNCPTPAASLIPLLLPKQSRPQTIIGASGLQQSAEKLLASSNPVSRDFSGISVYENSTEEYNNPLYNESPIPAAFSTRKTVSFSPVNVVFEEIEQASVTETDDSNVRLEENPESNEFNGNQEEALDYIDFDESEEYIDLNVSQDENPEYVSRSTSIGFSERI